MRVARTRTEGGDRFELIRNDGTPDPLAASFARSLLARRCSPHPVASYSYDLLRFYDFVEQAGLAVETFTVGHSIDLLAYLGGLQSSRTRQTSFPAVVRSTLAPTSINRAMAGIASFYDHLVL